MLYFAFGSNIDVGQMRRRCPGARVFGEAVLPKHRLVFNGFSQGWGGAVASVMRDDRSEVPGVVYEVGVEDVERLDGYEGHPWVYERRVRSVILSDGSRRRAHVYIHTQPNLVGRPSWKYVMTIWRAYQARGFDDSPLFDAGGF